MEQFIPIDKQSKKNQKAYYSRKRGSWGEINPVTRVVPNKKAYNRKKDKKISRYEDIPFVIGLFY